TGQPLLCDEVEVAPLPWAVLDELQFAADANASGDRSNRWDQKRFSLSPVGIWPAGCRTTPVTAAKALRARRRSQVAQGRPRRTPPPRRRPASPCRGSGPIRGLLDKQE